MLLESGNSDGVITPYIIKVSKHHYRKYAREPSDYSIAELGIICGIYGRESGLICTVYPNLDDMVNVFEVKFKSTKALRRVVHDVIETIEGSRESDDLLSLPKCPKYMDDKGKCPLIEECTDCT